MSKKGGYQIVDFKGVDITTETVIEGIFDIAQSKFGKPVLASGLNFGDGVLPDIFVEETIGADSIEFVAYGFTVTIGDGDSVEAVEIVEEPVEEPLI